MSSRRAVLAGLVLLAVAPAALAAPADDPKAFLAALYARVTAGDGTAGGVDFHEPATVRPKLFTASLCKLWKAAEKAASGDLGPIDFDLFSDSQDPLVKAVKIDVLSADATRARVSVALFPAVPKPGEAPGSTIVFDLRREGGGWKIDDMGGGSGDGVWRLRAFLTVR